MKTNDTPILDLMKDISRGKIQLPDFLFQSYAPADASDQKECSI
jgi:hypothetical protein